MARADKAAAVDELKNAFANSSAAVLTEYRGLTVANMKDLRRSLGEDATYAVAKNTLTKIAAREAGIEGLDEQLTGPTAIAFINGDVAAVAKSLRDFAKANPLLVIKAGILEGKYLDADDVKKLADLESREVLLSKVAGAMKASMSKAAATFAAPLSGFARLVGALEDKAKADPSVIGGAGTPVAAENQKLDDDSNESTAESSAPEAADAAEVSTDAASNE